MAQERDFGIASKTHTSLAGTETAMQNIVIGYKRFFIRGIEIICNVNPVGAITVKLYSKDAKGATYDVGSYVAKYALTPAVDNAGLYVIHGDCADLIICDEDANSNEIHYTLVGQTQAVNLKIRFHWEAYIEGS